ncbi:hypothetical protein P7C73_g2367, partial [Tremellales sp. Uapishka_1]
MQPEDQTPIDSTPIQTPSSPTLTSFTRHHPTQAPIPRPSLNARRSRDSSQIRVTIQPPNADLGEGSSRRKEGWSVARSAIIRDLKDVIARGDLEGLGRWQRDGMRLVWQGRILRDEEALGDIVGMNFNSSQPYNIYLVARPILSAQSSSSTTTVTAAVPDAPAADQATGSDVTPSSLALNDSIHYLLFVSRHHLCKLLSTPPLAWIDTVPPPLFPQRYARNAVMSVVRVYADDRGSREEGWEGWEDAFEDDEDVEGGGIRDSGRKETETLIMKLWASRVGRNWKEGADGESVMIELDEVQYQLHLPPLDLQSTAQLAHLLSYLRTTSLLPLLYACLSSQQQSAQQSAARLNQHATVTVPLQPREAYRYQIRIAIPMSVLSHMFFSFIKIAITIWMMTRNLSWRDYRFLVMAGAAAMWWIADGMAEMRRVRRERRANMPIPVPAAPQAGPGGEDGNDNVAAMPRRNVQRDRPALPSNTSLIDQIFSFIGLETDNHQLRLPAHTTDRRPVPANGPSQLAQMRNPSRRQPPRWQTQLVLPVWLWLVTLIPEFESVRARAIRKRERAMRVLVGELTAQAQQDQHEQEGEPVVERVLPDRLNVAAKRYYERVMQRGEGIDWEEEREAQRALGVGEEEEERNGGGGGFRML